MIYIESFSSGEYRIGKTRDCSVRALSNVTLAEYEECEQLFANYGRKLNRGAKTWQVIRAYNAFGLHNIQVYGNREKNAIHLVAPEKVCSYHKGITLGNFIKQNPVGRFVVLYSKHAVAVVDGKIIDTIDNAANRRIIACFSKP